MNHLSLISAQWIRLLCLQTVDLIRIPSSRKQKWFRDDEANCTWIFQRRWCQQSAYTKILTSSLVRRIAAIASAFFPLPRRSRDAMFPSIAFRLVRVSDTEIHGGVRAREYRDGDEWPEPTRIPLSGENLPWPPLLPPLHIVSIPSW